MGPPYESRPAAQLLVLTPQSDVPEVQFRYSPYRSSLGERMATLVKTPSGTWKAVIRKNGWPTVSKTFRTKRDAEDWSRRTEDEMVRGVYIQRSGSERMTLEAALKRYLSDVTPTKKPTTQRGEKSKAKKLTQHLGKYSLAALSAEIIAGYRDKRLGESGHKGNISNNTVRLELALLSHFLMHRYNWVRPHQFNGGLAPARAEEKLNVVSGIS